MRLERECDEALAKKLGPLESGTAFRVPYEKQTIGLNVNGIEYNGRAVNVGTASLGGYLVSTSNVGFIEMLRKRALGFELGAQLLVGLRDNANYVPNFMEHWYLSSAR